MPTERYQRVWSTVLLGAILLGLLALTGRLAYINSAYRPMLTAKAERQYHAQSLIPARRGMILDTRGRVVATSRYLPDVFVDGTRVKDIEELSSQLGVRLDLPVDSIRDRITRRPDSRFIRVAHEIDEITAEAVRELRNPAVGLKDRDVRSYPLGESMAHVVGFVGRDGTGLEGIEKSYDAPLRGQDGIRRMLVDVRRRPLGPSETGFRAPVDGGHVVLTIDAELQRIVEQVLDDTLRRHEAESGTAVVMDPYTGDILALACRPSYDPNEGFRTPTELRRNRALTDPVEPGSTFKPFVMYGALEGGFVRLDEKIDCRRGEHFFGSRRVTDTSPHGMLDPLGIITYSSNIGMGFIAQRMGNTALYGVVRRFGFGEPTGIDLPGEGSGRVRPLRRWGSMSAVSVGMGYEISATPLQLVTAFCSIANGGRPVTPRVVRRLVGPGGESAREFEVETRGPAFDAAVIRELREMMASAVENGTGRKAKLERYRVLGKTGTPKLTHRGGGGYEPGAYQPTFVGAAPASESRLAVVVTIRRPNAKLGYYGGVVAAPAGARILDEALQYLGISPDRETLLTGL